MAVYFKTLCMCVILISSVWQVYSMPVEKHFQTSKTVSEIQASDFEDVKSVRVKKALVVVETCPKGMQLYGILCLTTEKYNRLINQDYDSDPTEEVPVTNYETTHGDKNKNSTLTATDPISDTEYVVLDVIPLLHHEKPYTNDNEAKSTDTKHNDDNYNVDRKLQDITTVHQISSTAKFHNDQPVTSTTMPRSVNQTVTNTTVTRSDKNLTVTSTTVSWLDNDQTVQITAVPRSDNNVTVTSTTIRRSDKNQSVTYTAVPSSDNDETTLSTKVLKADENSTATNMTVSRSVNDQTVLSTTVPRSDKLNENGRARKIVFIVAVVLISCCAIAMIWYQRYRRNNKHEIDSTIVASSTEDIPETHASEHDRFLTCNTRVMYN